MILGQHILKLHESATSWPTAMSHKLLRVPTLHWHQTETAPGVFDFTKADAIFSKIPAGVSVILANSGTPRFYSARPDEPGSTGTFPVGTLAEPTDFNKFRTYLRTLKQRYPAIKYIEGPNEPGPGSGYCSSAMPAILDWQRAVWQESSGVTAISAPVVLTDSGFDTLKGLMATQGMHVVGVHFYSTKLDPMELDAALYRVRQIIDRSGNVGKPIAITEMGCNLPPYGIVRLRDLPAAMQVAFWEAHLPIAAKYVAIVVPFAYDDVDYGWQGTTAVEKTMDAMQVKYNVP